MRTRKNLYIHLLFLSIVVIFGCSVNNSLINLDSAKNAVREYYESGKYDSECKEIIDNAISEIEKLPVEKNAVVIFDVDDTALSGYEYTKNIGFGYDHQTWKQSVNDCKQKAVPQVKRFYDWLISKSIKVVFLTGRKEELYESTRKNLLAQGYTKFDTLIVRKGNESNLQTVEYKSGKRKELNANGYKIIANIGDQITDLEGEYTGIKIKLPNYLYLVN